MYIFEIVAKLPSALECQELAGDLLRAYTRYFDNQDYKIKLIACVDGELGIKNAILMVNADLSHLVKNAGLYRVTKLPSWKNTDRPYVHLASIQIFPVNNDSTIEVIHKQQPTSGAGGGMIKWCDYLQSSTDKHSITTEKPHRAYGGKSGWDELERDAEIYLRSRHDYTPSDSVIMQARYHPSSEFYCKFQNEEWDQNRLTEFWDGAISL